MKYLVALVVFLVSLVQPETTAASYLSWFDPGLLRAKELFFPRWIGEVAR